MNSTLNRRFFGTAKKYNLSKEDACIMASGGRTESVRELTAREVNTFCSESFFNQEERRRDQKRKQLIAMAYSIGEGTAFVKGWAEKYGVGSGQGRVVRKFNDYTLRELYALVKKFEKVVEDRVESVARIK